MTDRGAAAGLGIAVIGIACRFPGARGVDEYWQNLRRGVDSISTFTRAELLAADLDPAVVTRPDFVPAAGVLDDVESFDASFFGVAPREADLMDPQHRVFLEGAWEVLERAGYDPERYRGAIGAFAGVGPNTYRLTNLEPAGAVGVPPELAVVLGNSGDFLATRVAFKLNLRGPAVAIQASCASSLVAVHLAVQALLAGDCDMALAGGVSITLPPRSGHIYQEEGIYSPDGRCRPFSAASRGTVGGSGAGLVVLKRLSEAIADGDHIHAVLRGSAVNNDGSGKVGYTAPGVDGQATVIRMALAAAGVDAGTIGYVEAHGTATALGDPVEVAALTHAFRASTQDSGFCALGSVKSNLGHLDAAAGIASFIKAVLALEHREIPPTLHVEHPNPRIDFDRSPFYVNTSLAPWPAREHPRRAAVSAFGIGGTNAHVVLEEALAVPRAEGAPFPALLIVSARTPAALARTAASLAAFLTRHVDVPLEDVAYTLQVGRRAFGYRRAVVARDRTAAVAALEQGAGSVGDWEESGKRSVVFVLPDPGSRRVTDVERQLYREEAGFRAHVDQAATMLTPRLGADVRPVLAGAADVAASGQRLAAAARLVADYALARTWVSWGVQPQAVVGHGLGELTAACLAGVLSLPDAMSLLVAHGELREGGRDPATAPMTLIDGLELRPPLIPCVSGATGDWIAPADATDAGHWARLLRAPVAGIPRLDAVLADADRVFLAIGPSSTLREAVMDRATSPARPLVAASLPDGAGDGSALETLRGALGTLWVAGVDVDWAAVHAPRRCRRVPLPTYPFERRRHWIQPVRRFSAAGDSQLVRRPSVDDWFYVPSWKQSTLPGPAEGRRRGEGSHRWLLLAPDDELGTRVAERLERLGQDVVVATMGDGFTRTGPRRYTVDPRVPQDYVALLQDLRRFPAASYLVGHLWGLTEEGSRVPRGGALEQARDLGFHSLLFLVQALDRVPLADNIHLAVVTANVHDVTGEEERLRPEWATALGTCRVIPLEYPGVSCRGIDLARSGAAPWTGDDIESLVAELARHDSARTVALRGRRRWVQVFDPVHLGPAGGRPGRLRHRGVYVVTGGLGGVGLDTATYLARVARARLALIGRPAAVSADDGTRHASGNRGREAIEALAAVGGEVMLLDADVTRSDDLDGALRQVEARFGPINGVFHAAGAKKTAHRIRETGPAEWAGYLDPKVRGLVVLAETLRGRAIDLCVVHSSLSSVLGAAGFVAYAAGHAFMDAFTWHQTRLEGGRWMSVNWDNRRTWRDTDIPDPGHADLLMTADEAADALGRILSVTSLTQVAVSTADLSGRVHRWVEGGFRREAEDTREPGPHMAVHPRPELSVAYVAPQTAVERALAEIWAETLGVRPVGIHDNFFELGGDSVMSIHVAAKASRAGLTLRPGRIFEQPTIAELAGSVGVAAPAVERAATSDTVPLTPIQSWFFERALPDANEFALSMVVETPRDVAPAVLERVLGVIMARHDALRLRFTPDGTNWRQTCASEGDPVPLQRVDLAKASPAEQERRAREVVAALRAGLDLKGGPLVRAALLERGAGERARLAVVIHHLAVDVASWRILLEDLRATYQRLARGGTPPAPPAGASFRQAAETLARYARSAAVQEERGLWCAPAARRRPELPLDLSDGVNTVASARAVSVVLSAAETQALLRGTPRVYRARLEDMLLAALGQTLARWTGQRTVAVDLEGHAREELPGGLDVSGTVGWFTTMYPVVLDVEEDGAPETVVRSVRARLAGVPRQGLGYGLLRYMGDDVETRAHLRAIPPPAVSLVYLGQLDPLCTDDSPFHLVPDASGSSHGGHGLRSHQLEVVALVVDGRLRVHWWYSENLHRCSTIVRQTGEFLARLRALVVGCQPSVQAP